MIFGLSVSDDVLFSVSDDRRLSAWSLREGQLLDSQLGHLARPLSVCSAAHACWHWVVTGCADSTVCVWVFHEGRLELRRRLTLSAGPVRSLLITGSTVVSGKKVTCTADRSVRRQCRRVLLLVHAGRGGVVLHHRVLTGNLTCELVRPPVP